jgi:hypothetical protein
MEQHDVADVPPAGRHEDGTSRYAAYLQGLRTCSSPQVTGPLPVIAPCSPDYLLQAAKTGTEVTHIQRGQVASRPALASPPVPDGFRAVCARSR